MKLTAKQRDENVTKVSDHDHRHITSGIHRELFKDLLIQLHAAYRQFPKYALCLFRETGMGWLARPNCLLVAVIWAALSATGISSPTLANPGFKMPCLNDENGVGAMRFYQDFCHIEPNGVQVEANVIANMYFYSQFGPEFLNPPGPNKAKYEQVFTIARFHYVAIDEVKWRASAGFGFGSNFDSLQELFDALLLGNSIPAFMNEFDNCPNATNTMAGVVDHGANGTTSSFSDDMFALFDHVHNNFANFDDVSYCWSDLEYLFGNQNGGIASDATSVAQADRSPCTTTNPVSFFDGGIQLLNNDLEGLRSSSWFGHRRAYHNNLSQPYDGPNGFNWTIQQAPYLVQKTEGSTNYIVVMFDGNRSVWFEDTGTALVPRYGEEHVKLEHDAVNGEYRFTEQNGFNTPGSRSSVTQTKFQDFDQPLDKLGLFKEYTDVTGEVVEAESYGVGQIHALTRTLRDGTKEKIEYTYYDNTSLNERRLQYVSYTRLPSGQSTWINTSRAEYLYYGDTEDDGNLNDLKTVKSQQFTNGNWTPVAASHYRYWKDGQQDYTTKGLKHGLKYVFGPSAYQRAAAAVPGDPTVAQVDLVKDYADNYFEYDGGTGRVTKEIASSGCAGCGGGNGTAGDEFAYTDSTHSDDLNHWKRKTTVTHPDGLNEVLYMNYAGQVLMRVYQDGPDDLAYFYQYDNNGRLVLAASPSAVDLQTPLSTHETHADLLHDVSGNFQFLKDTQGLIRINNYDAASGQLSARKIQQGETGTPTTIESFVYTQTQVNGHTLYPLMAHATFPTTGSPNNTIFAYLEWHATGTQFKSRVTVLPFVSSGQNGPGPVPIAISEVVDEDGNLIWLRDERGFITHFQYRADLNRLTQRIDDVDGKLTTLPSGWSMQPGGGRHLVTDFEYDDLTRLTRTLGPLHEVVDGGTAKAVRSLLKQTYTINDETSDDQITIESGYLDTAEVILGPVSIREQDKTGRTTADLVVAASGDPAIQSDWQRWTSTQRNDKNQVTSVRVYHNIPTSGEGVVDTNYSETKFAYDAMGRRSRVESPDGTIARTLYDGRGRVTQVWVGTADGCECGDWDPVSDNVNLVLVTDNQYDNQDNLTQTTSYANATKTRVTTFTYDWRNRRVTQDGEVDRFVKLYYDNLDRVIKTERFDTTESGNLIARSETNYDDLGRVYQTVTHAVDPITGQVGNSLISNTWYDLAGNVIKTQAGAHNGSLSTSTIAWAV